MLGHLAVDLLFIAFWNLSTSPGEGVPAGLPGVEGVDDGAGPEGVEDGPEIRIFYSFHYYKLLFMVQDIFLSHVVYMLVIVA